MDVMTVCSTCEGAEGPAFADALRAALAEAGLGVQVRDWPCMNACARPVSLAFRAPQKATYLFGDVTLEDAGDVVAFAKLYAASPDGWIDDARAIGRLRHCLIGRVPA
ncbi:DUF1636 family protein [Roseovarius carneus]|uniref:DUF1636 family protein n=1 Tax=Roseovarius carneus TaxID=2853164 RepID=UPI001CCBB312|nr:DUF1636 domain-containing protein [Roseovarius carneus]